MSPAERRKAHRGNLALRLVALWALVFLLVELALGLLGVDTELLVLAGAAVIAAAAFDVLRHVTVRGLAVGIATAIAVVGVFMALDEAGIAPRIVNTLFLGLVLTAAGIAIVAVGGGGIEPMRARWTDALQRWQLRAATPAATPASGRPRDVDLRDGATERTAKRGPDDTTLVPSGDGRFTQERIRAEIRSETDTLP